MSSSTVSKEERLLLHLTPTSTFGGMTTQPWHKSPCLLSLSALQKILQREEESTCNTLTLRHAPNQTWNALAGIIHTTAWAENSRNTARRSGSPGDVPALCGPGQLDREQLRSSRHRRELVGSQLPTPSRCLHFDQRRRGPVIPRTNGCLFGEQTRTGFHCNLCRVRQWKHHSWVSLSEETAARQCK